LRGVLAPGSSLTDQGMSCQDHSEAAVKRLWGCGHVIHGATFGTKSKARLLFNGVFKVLNVGRIISDAIYMRSYQVGTIKEHGGCWHFSL
jgi:hypothetical protein